MEDNDCFMSDDDCSDFQLHYSVRENNIPLSVKLIKKGYDVNGRDNVGRTPLHYAYHYKYKELVDILLDNGASLFVKDVLGNVPPFYEND